VSAALLATKLPSAGTIVALAAVGALLVAVLVPLMRRSPDAFPLLAIASLPFRVPISADGRTVNLLVPLYVIVAAGTVAHVLDSRASRRAGMQRRSPEGIPAGLVARLGTPRVLEALLFGSVALYAVQAVYSTDHAKALENIAFFYVPFGLLFLLLSRVRWRRELLLRCLAIAVGLAVVFAGIGFIEYSRKSLFLNPKVVAANEYDNYFRVNSLFFDPNIYGRFLALVMIAVMTVVLWTRQRRHMYVGAGVLAWLLGGLITSFSQSSIAALLLGLAILAAWRWDVRATILSATGLLALALAVILLSPASLHFGLKGSSGSASNATSGRTKLISGGLSLFAQRPLWGYGSGSFEKEYRDHASRREATVQNATSASHTIPVTVAAEQGLPGLVLYVLLIGSALLVLCTGAGRAPPRMAIAACFAALVLHTWTYADFLEDPFTWALLAVGVALAREARAARASSF